MGVFDERVWLAFKAIYNLLATMLISLNICHNSSPEHIDVVLFFLFLLYAPEFLSCLAFVPALLKVIINVT